MKQPLKFTKTCPLPEELWRIIDDTVQNVSSELGISVEEAKLFAFCNLLAYPGAYTENKMYVKETITEARLVAIVIQNHLIIPMSSILDISLKLPPKVIDYIGTYLPATTIRRYFEDYHNTIFKAIEVSKEAHKLLNNLNVEIDESLEPIVIESKEELKLVILSHMVEGISLPPLQKKEVPL